MPKANANGCDGSTAIRTSDPGQENGAPPTFNARFDSVILASHSGASAVSASVTPTLNCSARGVLRVRAIYYDRAVGRPAHGALAIHEKGSGQKRTVLATIKRQHRAFERTGRNGCDAEIANVPPPSCSPA
ncbi:MAG: hypothetical protein ABSF64_18095 [Bryobacteraceae bacterium]|jgi:hypothetical protein